MHIVLTASTITNRCLLSDVCVTATLRPVTSLHVRTNVIVTTTVTLQETRYRLRTTLCRTLHYEYATYSTLQQYQLRSAETVPAAVFAGILLSLSILQLTAKTFYTTAECF